MKSITLTKRIVEIFIEEAMLSDDEIKVLEMRAKQVPVARQAQIMNMSESSINRITKRLKEKYDIVQKYNPELPLREK